MPYSLINTFVTLVLCGMPTALGLGQTALSWGIGMVQVACIHASGTHHLLPNGPMERFYLLAQLEAQMLCHAL